MKSFFHLGLDSQSNSEDILWSKDEDSYLKALVTDESLPNWKKISSALCTNIPGSHKTDIQCQERWKNKLSPSINFTQWTMQEEAALLLAHMNLKDNWEGIANQIHRRNKAMVKKRFNQILENVKDKIKGNNFIATSKLEFLEMHYILVMLLEKVNYSKISTENNSNCIPYEQIEAYYREFIRKNPLKTPIIDSLKKIMGLSQNPANISVSPIIIPLQIPTTREDTPPEIIFLDNDESPKEKSPTPPSILIIKNPMPDSQGFEPSVKLKEETIEKSKPKTPTLIPYDCLLKCKNDCCSLSSLSITKKENKETPKSIKFY